MTQATATRSATFDRLAALDHAEAAARRWVDYLDREIDTAPQVQLPHLCALLEDQALPAWQQVAHELHALRATINRLAEQAADDYWRYLLAGAAYSPSEAVDLTARTFNAPELGDDAANFVRHVSRRWL